MNTQQTIGRTAGVAVAGGFRPSWPDYFMGLAFAASRKSPDTQTQHGAIVVSPDTHRTLATGCNGWPRKLKDDHTIPTTRPEKYPWMIHAEHNAVLSAEVSLEGATCYVTGRSCVACLMLMHQKGIARVVECDRRGWNGEDQEAGLRADFLTRSGMRVEVYRPDLSWLAELVRSHIVAEFCR